MNGHTADATPVPEPQGHMGMLPTAEFMDGRVLARSMEATCHNLDQHNPDPEPNSIFEFMGIEISAMDESPRKRRLTVLLAAAIESNGLEGDLSKAISGDMDEAITEVRRLAANSGQPRYMNVHDVVKALRRPLEILRDPAGRTEEELAAAGAAVDDVIAAVPKHRLLSSSVLHNLGKAKAAVLIERVANR